MKDYKTLHTVLGIIPLAWFISFLLILLIGTIHFGYVPEYGNPIVPYALHLDFLSIIHFILGVFAYLVFFPWILLTIHLIFSYNKQMCLNKLSVILFSIGVSGFFIFKYLLTDNFAWVMD